MTPPTRLRAAAVVILLALALVPTGIILGRLARGDGPTLDAASSGDTMWLNTAGDGAVTAPIAAEAFVFQAPVWRPGLDPDAAPSRPAHPRTLATYRARRAHSGAPPRIPHGLSTEEHLGSRCRTCHERGGYSPRFGTYVPVTPHPELGECLQCHLPDDEVVGIPAGGAGPDAVCRQCHAAGGRAPSLPAMASSSDLWPSRASDLPGGAPPPIPHDLQMRGRCNACHAGPAAVREIRTDHWHLTDCRTCHLAVEANQPELGATGNADARPGGGAT